MHPIQVDAKMAVAVCCLFVLLSSLAVHPSCSFSVEEQTNSKLSQSAPYTIFDKADRGDQQQNKTTLRNVIFRLTNHRASGLLSAAGGEKENSGDAWMLIGPNGTVVGQKLNLNIERLLESLNSNNFTSEVRSDQQDPTQIVNITISASPLPANNAPPSSLDEMLLEELIMDAMSSSSPSGGAGFAPIYIRDNHRFDSRNKTSLRPKPPQQHQLNGQSSELVTMITPPPIIRVQEVVAENYTIRQVSEEANVFALKLLHQINLEKLGSRNLVQAPFVVYQGLGLLMTGSMGDTAKELDKVLLGVQSTYENQKLTHDQDKNRLLASFSEVLRQLHSSATHHLRSRNPLVPEDPVEDPLEHQQFAGESSDYDGGTQDQHLVLANNLLFSPSAYEISPEFKQYLNGYFNQTALTKIEVGSTEAIQTINGWIRRATHGLVASIIDRRQTFDETNVMTLLSSSWLQQEWRDSFYKVASPLRSGIRLKGQGRASGNFGTRLGDERANLLEFLDDNKQSHFVEYIKSEPTKNIHVYKSVLSGQPVELVTIPFRDSQHRMIIITPRGPISGQSSNASMSLQQQQQLIQLQQLASTADGTPAPPQAPPVETLPDSSALSKLISVMASNPRKVMRSMWNIIAPDIITKQTLQTIQQARQKNITVDEQLVGANVIPLIQLSVPILRMGSDSSLSAAMNHIGLVNTFDPYQANFIGINGHPFNYYKLHLSNVIFKTTFNLNERGINYDKTIRTLESVRVHSSISKQQQQQQQPSTPEKGSEDGNTFKLEYVDDVKLDRPFVYMICDMRTKLILYTGALRNPAQGH